MPEVSDLEAKKICESFIENLVSLHSLDIESAGLSDFGKPFGYERRQVEGWTKRYFNAKTDEWSELESAIEWLNQKIPETNLASLIHNDYKFDNIILNPNDLTKIVAVLDWEMATIGSPLMDFGTTLGYWADISAPKTLFYAGFNPPKLMQTISRQELAEIYAEKSGRDLSNILYYYVFGLFKIAVIAQQIYARFAKGFTKDERFAKFNLHVKILGEIATKAIETEKI
jgi:aminoglycoside phosphotransferase (APT) family kinase protein